MGGAHAAAALRQRHAGPLAGTVMLHTSIAAAVSWRATATWPAAAAALRAGSAALEHLQDASSAPHQPPQLVSFVTHGGRPQVPPRDQLPGEDTAQFEGLEAYIDLMQRCWAQVGAGWELACCCWAERHALSVCWGHPNKLHGVVVKPSQGSSVHAMCCMLCLLCRNPRRAPTLRPLWPSSSKWFASGVCDARQMRDGMLRQFASPTAEAATAYKSARPSLLPSPRRALLSSLLGSSDDLMSPTHRRLLSERSSGEAELRASGGSGTSGQAAAAAQGSNHSMQGQETT